MIKKSKNLKTKKTNKATVKRVSRKTISKSKIAVILKKNIDDQELFNLDHFLIDEQENCSVALKSETTANKEALKEIDRLIKAEAALAFNLKELLPKREFKIQLNRQGRLAKINQTHERENSAYLINLKKPASVINKQQQKANFKEEVRTSNLAPSLLKPHSFSENLEKFWSIWSVKLQRSKRQAGTVAPDNSNRWLFNLKVALNFAFIGLLLILPIRGLFFYQHLSKTKGQILGVSQEAWQELKQGAMSASQADWQSASFSFGLASSYLAEAQATVEQYRHSLLDLVKLIPAGGTKVVSLENLLLAGQSLTNAAEGLASTLSATASSGSGGLEQLMTADFASLAKGLDAAQADLDKSFGYLNKVKPEVIPQEYRQSFVDFSLQLGPLSASLKRAEEFLLFAMEMLGQQTPKRYLIMMQNTNEARPAGGFFGTFALLDLKKGKITNLEVPPGGTYDLKGYYTGPRIRPPEPLTLIGSAWSAWDANYFADFPSSAKKVAWFFEQSGWPTVDGVIAINSSLIPELLKIVGNIELPKYNKVLTPEEAILALEHATLFEYDKAKNAPKEIITDLTPVLLKRLFGLSGEAAWPLVLTLEQALAQKEIQLYFSEQSLQERAENFGWTGEIKPSSGDYLLAVDTNIAGGKTNAYLTSQINLYSYVQPDGSLINTVAITRHHHGDEIDPKSAAYVLAKQNNVAYLRIYVPQGSELLEVSGQTPPEKELFKEPYPNFSEDEYLRSIQGQVALDEPSGTAINNEAGKTVFGNWLQVKPGEEKTLTFSYRLPFKLDLPNVSWWQRVVNLFRKTTGVNHNYSLLVQRQSGANQTTLKSFLFLPDNLKIDWLKSTNGSTVSQTDQGASLTSELKTDQYYAAVLRRR